MGLQKNSEYDKVEYLLNIIEYKLLDETIREVFFKYAISIFSLYYVVNFWIRYENIRINNCILRSKAG